MQGKYLAPLRVEDESEAGVALPHQVHIVQDNVVPHFRQLNAEGHGQGSVGVMHTHAFSAYGRGCATENIQEVASTDDDT
jgi:hypothetical protein